MSYLKLYLFLCLFIFMGFAQDSLDNLKRGISYFKNGEIYLAKKYFLKAQVDDPKDQTVIQMLYKIYMILTVNNWLRIVFLIYRNILHNK